MKFYDKLPFDIREEGNLELTYNKSIRDLINNSTQMHPTNSFPLLGSSQEEANF